MVILELSILMKSCEKQIRYVTLSTYIHGYSQIFWLSLQTHGRIHLSYPFEVGLYDLKWFIKHKQK